MKYSIPAEYYRRLHHIRPRFKNEVEDVLVHIASEISQLEPAPKDEFYCELDKIIRRYPGNSEKERKTIANWRTEISSLFGFFQYKDDIIKPGNMALLLAKDQDLIQFFRYFLFFFQYPGGHLKPHETADLINTGVKFKPATYLIEVLLKGMSELDGKFGISKEEATHCIFNDLRVTRDGRSPSDTFDLIHGNRREEYGYDSTGDIIRYAGDILDYLELADMLIHKPDDRYYLNTIVSGVIHAFVTNASFFPSYESLYVQSEVNASDVARLQACWFEYVNSNLKESIFEANVISLLEEAKADEALKADESAFINDLLSYIREEAKKGNISTKKVGDVGESIVLKHEVSRVKQAGRDDLIHLIQKIPNRFAVGYDISSIEINEEKRYIEVKTTISKKRLFHFSFSMTTNEWRAAKTLQDHYFVYRLLISSESLKLFVIQNPVKQYKTDSIDMTPIKGANITYSEGSGNWLDLLL